MRRAHNFSAVLAMTVKGERLFQCGLYSSGGGGGGEDIIQGILLCLFSTTLGTVIT